MLTQPLSHALDARTFPEQLFDVMKQLNPALEELEPYEFRYCMNNLVPEPGGWESVQLDSLENIERRINDLAFYKSIQIKANAIANLDIRLIKGVHISYVKPAVPFFIINPYIFYLHFLFARKNR